MHTVCFDCEADIDSVVNEKVRFSGSNLADLEGKRKQFPRGEIFLPELNAGHSSRDSGFQNLNERSALSLMAVCDEV